MSHLEPSRREFLLGSGAWLGAAALGFAKDRGPGLKTISIFHTTDLHGHIVPTQTYGGVGDLGGFARCASCIRQWRKEAPDSLLVDLGDVYQGTAESLLNRGGMMMASSIASATMAGCWVITTSIGVPKRLRKI